MNDKVKSFLSFTLTALYFGTLLGLLLAESSYITASYLLIPVQVFTWAVMITLPISMVMLLAVVLTITLSQKKSSTKTKVMGTLKEFVSRTDSIRDRLYYLTLPFFLGLAYKFTLLSPAAVYILLGLAVASILIRALVQHVVKGLEEGSIQVSIGIEPIEEGDKSGPISVSISRDSN